MLPCQTPIYIPAYPNFKARTGIIIWIYIYIERDMSCTFCWEYIVVDEDMAEYDTLVSDIRNITILMLLGPTIRHWLECNFIICSLVPRNSNEIIKDDSQFNPLSLFCIYRDVHSSVVYLTALNILRPIIRVDSASRCVFKAFYISANNWENS